jgi:EAL domain-containing protein (putative c-di-GMP-specific phosphodiesterase class I)/putative methionine-R-sulfoxide reductase with GAF domain
MPFSVPSRATSPVDDVSLQATLEGLCVPGVIRPVVQPVVRLADLAIVGYEALARMPTRPHLGPDWWLERAGELGMRPRLEIACWRAIAALGPPPGDTLLFVNASPAVLAEPDLLALRGVLPNRLVIEVTEQEAVADYLRLRQDLLPWLSRHAHLAIDDTGAGHSSLRHVIELSPDFLKIDRSLVRGVADDRNRRALVHSLVAFAREVGSTVVAEGVETADELETLREAQVHLAQGYLFARPAPPWPGHALEGPRAGAPVARRAGGAVAVDEAEFEALVRRVALASDARSASEAIVEHLHRRGLLSSLYLERGGRLRCVAQRGLWQVLDGMSGTAGITGRTWAAHEAIVVDDVTGCDDYLEAIPGVMAEACVPVTVEGRSIGALNVESLSSLPPGTLELLRDCADLLGRRLRVLGWRGRETPWRRAAQAAVSISKLTLELHTPERALDALRAASGMDSVCLVRAGGGAPEVVSASGALGAVLARLSEHELVALAGLVVDVSSCYTANDATGRGFVGTESLRASARAIVVLPLRSGGDDLGFVVLASSTPRALTGDEVEPLEVLTGLLAATFSASDLLDRLRRQAVEDSAGCHGHAGARPPGSGLHPEGHRGDVPATSS